MNEPDYDEPWEVDFLGGNGMPVSIRIADACCREVATSTVSFEFYQAAMEGGKRFQRIAACVNACRGIPTDVLTKHGVIPNAFDVPFSSREFDEIVDCSPALKKLAQQMCGAYAPTETIGAVIGRSE